MKSLRIKLVSPIIAILILLTTAALSSPAQHQRVWVNTAGRSFSARLTALNDRHATFVMEDGETEVIAVAALHPDSQEIARRLWNLPEIPDVLRATFDLNLQYLRRIKQLHEDDLLKTADKADAKRKLLNGFRYMYRKHKLPEDGYKAIEQRLLNAAKSDPQN